MNYFHDKPILYINSISTGFIEIPNQISLNIYVSGCFKRCKNCHNSHLQNFNKTLLLNEQMFNKMLQLYKMANWVCFLGGDAVYQPKGLETIAQFSKKSGKRVCLYTGILFSELEKININDIDLIIDGPYEEQKGTVDSSTTNQHCYINENGIWRAILFKDLRGYKWDTK